MYSYCGFGNALLFEAIDEDDISAVENFARDELLQIISENAESTNDTDDLIIQKEQLIENFGELYALKPQKFRFLPGDRKFIQLVKNNIRDQIKKKGRKRAMNHFGFRAEKKKKENQKSQTECDLSIDNDSDINCIDSISALKTKLHKQILENLTKCGVHQCMKDIFNESFVRVSIDNAKITGYVICVVCYVQSENPKNVKPKNVFCRGKSGSKSWVTSNFIKHLTRAHSKILNCNENEFGQLIEELIVDGENIIVYDESNSTEESDFVPNFCSESFVNDCNLNGNEEIKFEVQLNSQILKQSTKMWQAVLLNGENLE